MWQAEHIAGRLQSNGFSVELVPITTTGDLLQGSLSQSGGIGLFTKEIQRALLDHRCDIAVHSLKDLPTVPVDGLILAAVPQREDPADCLVSRGGQPLDSLDPGAVIGTGSPRRRAQLLSYRPDLVLKDIRGNVDTRLKKLGQGEFDAIVLAVAGLRRMGNEESITQRLPFELMLPAVGQAALGLETRDRDEVAIHAVRTLDDPETHLAVQCERDVLRQLQAGCLAPVAAHAHWEEDSWNMACRVYTRRFDRCIRAQYSVAAKDGDHLRPDIGKAVVDGIMTQLISQNAIEIVSESDI
jgi:hydroxymethylbilane synthase